MKRIALIALIALVAFVGVADAKLIEGKVLSVDATGSVKISQLDAATGVSTETTVTAQPETELLGIDSVQLLKEGDEVSVDSEEDVATGSWIAISIELKAAEAPAATPTI